MPSKKSSKNDSIIIVKKLNSMSRNAQIILSIAVFAVVAGLVVFASAAPARKAAKQAAKQSQNDKFNQNPAAGKCKGSSQADPGPNRETTVNKDNGKSSATVKERNSSSGTANAGENCSTGNTSRSN